MLVNQTKIGQMQTVHYERRLKLNYRFNLCNKEMCVPELIHLANLYIINRTHRKIFQWTFSSILSLKLNTYHERQAWKIRIYFSYTNTKMTRLCINATSCLLGNFQFHICYLDTVLPGECITLLVRNKYYMSYSNMKIKSKRYCVNFGWLRWSYVNVNYLLPVKIRSRIFQAY